MKQVSIPQNIIKVVRKLEAAGFEAFVVGGCVRDLLLGREPRDWDVATNAKPKEVLRIFPEGKYENAFGTVLIPQKYLLDLKILSEEVKISQDEFDRLRKTVLKYIKKFEKETYDEGHSQRTALNALEIAKHYKKVNKEIVELVSLFHDVGKLEGELKRHIEKSKEIFKEETRGILSAENIRRLIRVIDHRADKVRKYLEEQILLEADLIDAISLERCQFAQKYKPDHFEWIKESFNDEKIYRIFKTPKGIKLLKNAISSFNQAEFGFKLPEYQRIVSSDVEITTYRIESKYTDKRHPDEVRFAKTLEEDLSRRDFTVNAMALRLETKDAEQKTSVESLEFKAGDFKIIDLFGGQKDLNDKIIRAVGDAEERFNEDALRMMRAVRFVTQLETSQGQTIRRSKQSEMKNKKNPKKKWEIERKTLIAVKKNAANLKYISKERIRDELIKIILSDQPAKGVNLLVETGLMKYIVPEIGRTFGVRQNRHHYYGPYNTVYKHLLASLEKCPSKKLEVRLAAFLHDIGKPIVKKGEGELATFHGHEYVGARITDKILCRLKFPRQIIDKTVLLVKNHMFYYNVDEVGEAGVRRVVRKVGLENINDLIDVRIADRLGSGVPKAVPYKLRHFKYMVEKVSTDPISVKQLKINGNILMGELGLKPGPRIGAIMEVLLARVIEDPRLNNRKKLLELAQKLKKENLENLRSQARDKIEKRQEKEEEKMKKKYWV